MQLLGLPELGSRHHLRLIFMAHAPRTDVSYGICHIVLVALFGQSPHTQLTGHRIFRVHCVCPVYLSAFTCFSTQLLHLLCRSLFQLQSTRLVELVEEVNCRIADELPTFSAHWHSSLLLLPDRSQIDQIRNNKVHHSDEWHFTGMFYCTLVVRHQ